MTNTYCSRLLKVISLGCVISHVLCLDFDLPAGGTECLYQFVEHDNKLIGNFEVIAGGMLDIDVVVTDPAGNAHYEASGESANKFEVNASMDGKYRVCFINRFTSQSTKTIGFDFHVGDQLYKDLVHKGDVSQLEAEVSHLRDQVDRVSDSLKHVLRREKEARDTNESTNTRVLFFAGLELIVLLAVSAWQVYALKSFFEYKAFV